MKWASALSEAQETGRALDEATAELKRQLGADEPDLVVGFVSPHHTDAYEALPARIAAAFPRALFSAARRRASSALATRSKSARRCR